MEAFEVSVRSGGGRNSTFALAAAEEDGEEELLRAVYEALCDDAAEALNGAPPTWGYLRSETWNALVASGVRSLVPRSRKPDSEIVSLTDFCQLLFQRQLGDAGLWTGLRGGGGAAVPSGAVPSGLWGANGRRRSSIGGGGRGGTEMDLFEESLKRDITSPFGIGDQQRTASQRWRNLHGTLGLNSDGAASRSFRSSALGAKTRRRLRLLEVVQLMEEQKTAIEASMEDNAEILRRIAPPQLPDHIQALLGRSLYERPAGENHYAAQLERLNELRKVLARARQQNLGTDVRIDDLAPLEAGCVAAAGYAPRPRSRQFPPQSTPPPRATGRSSRDRHTSSAQRQSPILAGGDTPMTTSLSATLRSNVTPNAASATSIRQRLRLPPSASSSPLGATLGGGAKSTARSSRRVGSAASPSSRGSRGIGRKTKVQPAAVARREPQLDPNRFFSRTEQSVTDEMQLAMWVQGQPRAKLLFTDTDDLTRRKAQPQQQH